MPTIRLTPTACTSSPGWYDLRYVGNTSGLRQVIFTIPNNETLGGAGVNITGITFHGYVRNSASAVKRLKFGCKPSTSAAPNEWSTWNGSSVLDGVFTAANASGNGKYQYFNVSRTLSGTALERFSEYIHARFSQGSALYIGVIQPDASKSIQVNTSLGYWVIDVTYELLGNVPSASPASVALKASVKTTIQKVVSGSSTTLRYKIGSTTLATYPLGTGTTHTYTVPESAGAYFKTTATAQLTIEAETFVGGVSYGVVSTSVTLTLPSDAAPAASCTPNRTWVSGVTDAGKLAAYVQGKSGINFAMAGSGKYGATIASYELVIENKTYTTSGNSIGHSPISGSGTVSYKYTVRDSRGLSRTYSASLTVIAWKKPSITTFEVERVTEGNAIAVDGTCVRATVKASVSSLKVGGAEKNSLKYYVRYRKAGTETWTNCDTETLRSISVNKSAQLKKSGAVIDTFDDMTGYEFQVIVTDLYDSSQANNALATKEIWWDVDHSNGSMGFGGDANRQNLRIVDGVNVKAVASGTGAASGTYAYVITAPGAPENDDFGITCENGQFKIVSKNAPASQKVAGTMMGGLTSSGVPNIWFFSNQSTVTAFNEWLAEQAEAGTPVILRYEGSGKAFNFYGPIIAQNGVFGVEQFSTLETETGNVWIDGKKIYARMFTAQTPSTANHQSYLAATMSGMDAVWVDTSATFFARKDTGQVYPHGYVAGDGGRQFMVSPDPANDRFVIISDGAGSVYIRLLYTKQ